MDRHGTGAGACVAVRRVRADAGGPNAVACILAAWEVHTGGPNAVACILAAWEVHDGGRSPSAAGVSAPGNRQADAGACARVYSSAVARSCGKSCACPHCSRSTGAQVPRVIFAGAAASSNLLEGTPSGHVLGQCWALRHLLRRPPSLAVLQHGAGFHRLGFLRRRGVSGLPAPSGRERGRDGRAHSSCAWPLEWTRAARSSQPRRAKCSVPVCNKTKGAGLVGVCVSSVLSLPPPGPPR